MRTQRLLFSILCAALAGCGPAGTSAPLTRRPVAALQVVSGDQQHGVVGKELANPLVVRVLDDHGGPVKGQLVNFRVVQGGGSTFAGSGITDDGGVAQERWTLGTSTASLQRLEARAVDNSSGEAIVFASFDAMAGPDLPTRMMAVGDAQTAAAGTQPSAPVGVIVQDRYGNPVPHAVIHFTVRGGGGSVEAEDVTADANGSASAQWTLGAALGSNELEADMVGLAPVVLTATAVAYLPAPVGNLTVYTTFGPYATCAQAGVASIYYSLYAASGAVYSSSNVPCEDPTPGILIANAASGQYTFRFLQGLDLNGVAIYDLCNEVINFDNVSPIALPLQPIVNGVTCR